MLHSLSSRYFAVIIGSAITSVLVYYAGSTYGPGLTYDSINYLYAGHALYEKGVLLRPLKAPYVEWPPLYPAIIACLNSFSDNLLQAVLVFQVIVAGITVWLTGNITAKLLNNSVLFYTAFLAIAFSTPLILVNHFVWSESIFLLLILLQMYLLINYTSHPTQRIWYLLLFNGILLCSQRQTGILFILAGSLVLIIYANHYTLAERAAKSILYGIISAAPLVLWWIRSYRLRGFIMGDFNDTLLITPFFEHWSAYSNVFTAWFLPNELPVWFRSIIIYGVLAGLISKFVRLHKASTPQQKAASIFFILFISYFVLAFIACLVIGEYIDDRILAPIYIPGILVCVMLLEQYLITTQATFRNWILIGCCIWLVYPFTRSIVNVHNWRNLQKSIPVSQPVEEEFRHFLFK